MTTKNKPLIGGHVSAAAGVYNAIANGERIGAAAIQIFGSSPRQFSVRIPSADDAKKFRELQKKSAIKEVYLHAPYLVNIASQSAQLRAISKKVLIGHLRIAEMLGAVGLIFHVGSGKEMPKDQAMNVAVACMKEVLKSVSDGSYLVIENAAGGGQKLGSLPEEIGEMLDRVKSKRLKVCLDTAHLFEAGVIDSFEPADIKKHFDRWDTAVGLSNIVALHANDSKTPHNSRNDKHENIGKGYIGLQGFKNLAQEKRLWDKAWLLEVPGFKHEGPDKKNVDVLKSCFR